MSLQRHRLPPECVAYIQRCRYDAWLWLPPQDPAAKPPPNWRPLWLPLHCAAARFARLRFVPRQPNPQRKEQHQENSHSSLPASFSPYCSLIKSTKPVSEMLARRGFVIADSGCLLQPGRREINFSDAATLSNLRSSMSLGEGSRRRGTGG